MARLPGLAEGELELEKRGEGYSTRGQGYALLVNAATSQEIADAFKTEVFPHAMEGFMEAYRTQGAALFDNAAKTLFKDLGIELEKQLQLDKDKHVFLTPAQLEQAIQTVKTRLARLYEDALSKKGSK